MNTYKTLQTDVLVIGAGGAGLRSAIEAKNRGAKVLIVSKEYLGGAHTSMAMGGLNVAIKKPATAKQHYQDTINGGWGINNYKMVKIFTQEMPERIYDLESYGVKFDRLPDGSYYTWAGGKQSAPLNLCAGDYTGREMINGLVKEIKRLKIPYLQDYFVTRLFTKQRRVIGAFLIDLKTGNYSVVEAKVTIVATGGAGMMYLVNTNAPSNTGEGYAWALDVDAKLIDMEMVQFHPTGMAYKERKGKLITEKVRGHGGILKNKHGERFMFRYQPKRLELAGRDEVARAIYQEVKEGRGTKNNGVYLDITHWEKGKAEKIIPDVFADHMEIGIDIRKQMMEVYPSMHHMMGGIDITLWGETNIPGLFAVGEVTRNIHGANRLGGNSLAEGQVFGRRAGIKAAHYVILNLKGEESRSFAIAQDDILHEIKRLEQFRKQKSGLDVKKLTLKLQTVMWENVGLIRDEKKLKLALKEIKKLQKDAHKTTAKNKEELQMCLELQEMLKVAETVVVCAILRKESRGAHYRTDYPQMDPKWEKNIMVYKKNGEMKTKVVPVIK